MSNLEDDIVVLGWTFAPPDYFEEPIQIKRDDYVKLAQNRSYFGEFDPFGDFDLIFGAARMGLKIVEVPIVYRERTYGETNISRWRHGAILLSMLLFASRKIKFL